MYNETLNDLAETSRILNQTGDQSKKSADKRVNQSAIQEEDNKTRNFRQSDPRGISFKMPLVKYNSKGIPIEIDTLQNSHDMTGQKLAS